MYDYLISVIIPTRNRQLYAEAAVRQILSLNQNIQIIIHDNSDNSSLCERLIDVIDEKCIIYKYVPERIASIDNFDMAMKYACGEFLIAIGDDDGLLSNISDCARIMKENSIDAIKPATHFEYHWIDKNDSEEKKRKRTFDTTYFSGRAFYYDPSKSVIQLLKRGGQGYSLLPMAGTYHRLVRMEVFEKVKSITGKYYGGLSPDMYSSVCLSLIPNISFAQMDYPISLPGVCSSSTSAASTTGAHSGRLESAPHFIGMKSEYAWDDRVPRYYSVETIWAETMLKALVGMNRNDLIEKYFNQDYLIASMYKNKRNPSRDIEELVGKDKIESLNIKEIEETNTFRDFISKAQNYVIRRIPGNGVVNAHCENIEEAVNEMNELINSRIMKYKWTQIKKALMK